MRYASYFLIVATVIAIVSLHQLRLLWWLGRELGRELGRDDHHVQAFFNSVAEYYEAASLLGSSSNHGRMPRRNVILYGPHDRFNFGDLLFEKVVSHLLVKRAGYLPEELIPVGMTHVNMSKYGGHPNIISAKKAIELSRQATLDGFGPFDVVFLGGQALGCSHWCGVGMLATEKQRQQAKKERIAPNWNCAYLFPKRLLLPPNANNETFSKQPVAIVNSAGQGGTFSRSGRCFPAVETANFVALRDLTPGTKHKMLPAAQARPDSAVMVNELFHDLISHHAEIGPVPSIVRKATPYVAVQIKKGVKVEPKRLANMLDTIWGHTNLTTVFFRAGSAPSHDSLQFYKKIAQTMQGPSFVYEEENVWSVVALISRARAVISTSLHVRIMAFIHQKPRVTLCTGPGNKHENFVRIWEASDASPCLGATDSDGVWPALEKMLNAPTVETERAIQKATQSYLEGFDIWSSLLNQ